MNWKKSLRNREEEVKAYGKEIFPSKMRFNTSTALPFESLSLELVSLIEQLHVRSLN